MAKVSRYVSCPAAGKIRRRVPTIGEILSKRKARKQRRCELFTIGDYWPACYPSGKR